MRKGALSIQVIIIMPVDYAEPESFESRQNELFTQGGFCPVFIIVL